MNMKNRIELDGIAVCNPKRVGNTVKVTIANNRYKRLSDGSSEQEALYMQVTCFNQLAEEVQSSVQKGSFVSVEGRLHMSAFTDKAGMRQEKLEIIVDSLSVMKD